jgi:CNT family concentrative nucleoside transporter
VPSFLISLLGIFTLLCLAFALSRHKNAIRLRTILGALIIQIGLGAFVLYVPAGKQALNAAATAVSTVVSYGNEGILFLFGGLASDKMFTLFGDHGFIFAFRVLPIIIFISSFIAVLYHFGVMQWVVKILGGILHMILGTSRTESMSATANIFLGQTESPLLVRPYIAKMTESELFAVMCGGLASISGSVLAGYAGLGVKMEYLIAASFMAAPGGLLFAKILLPETGRENDDIDTHISYEETRPHNAIEAAANGATSGLKLALNIGAMLLAFIGLIALLNGFISWASSWFGHMDVTLEYLLGYIFSPIAYIIGVPWSEAHLAGSFIGQKLVLNEFVAYVNFSPYLDTAQASAQGLTAISEKTKAIISFALCGFANLSSIAILVGGLGSIAPARRRDIARLGIKAVIAGTLSNLMSATIAGLFLSL